MIYLESINSIIECIYLEESITENIGNSDIFVNPEKISYLTGKLIIINEPYSIEDIKKIVVNNTVISRVYNYSEIIPEVLFEPYLIRPNFNIMWNGEEINVEVMEDILEYCTFNEESVKLLFPKVNTKYLPIVGDEGNLTALGWALHQVGLNIDLNSKFIDLDALKTKKLRL